MRTLNTVNGNCAILLHNALDAANSNAPMTTSETTFYYKIMTETEKINWNQMPIEPSQDPSGSTVADGTEGWYLYDAVAGVAVPSIGENMLHAISVRGGEFQSHSSVVISLDTPYTQITSVAFQSDAVDSSADRYKISGTLVLTQGNAPASADVYKGYWGLTKKTFYYENQCTVTIAAQDITENPDVVVTQGSVTGTLTTGK